MTSAMPEPELDDLYRELILDHYRSPRNKGRLAGRSAHAEGYNPLCGDEIELDIAVERGVVEDVAFRGRGCSISQASGSMMTEAVRGKSLADARRIMDSFRKMMMASDGEPDPELGDLEAFQGVSRFPVRVKCATLAWRVLEEALTEDAGEHKIELTGDATG